MYDTWSHVPTQLLPDPPAATSAALHCLSHSAHCTATCVGGQKSEVPVHVHVAARAGEGRVMIATSRSDRKGVLHHMTERPREWGWSQTKRVCVSAQDALGY